MLARSRDRLAGFEAQVAALVAKLTEQRQLSETVDADLRSVQLDLASLQQRETKEREIAGLGEAMEKFSLKKGYIITLSEDTVFDGPRKKIQVIPLWKFLLSGLKKF